MSFFSWLGSLFGGKKKTKIPTKVVEYKNRPSGSTARRSEPSERSYERASSQDYSPPTSSGGGRDMFELAGDRAAKAKEQQAAAPPPTPPPAPPPIETEFVDAPSFEDEPAPPDTAPTQPVETAPSIEDNYSPLDLAREIQGKAAPTPPTDIASDPVFHPDDAYAPEPLQHYIPIEKAAPMEIEEPEPQTYTIQSSDEGDESELESIGVKFNAEYEPQAAEPSDELPSPEPIIEPDDEVEPLQIQEAASDAPVAEAVTEALDEPTEADDPEARMLDKLKDQTVEGSTTITIERRRIETKSINIGGENFEIALYEYQNGTHAARVPRAAIERMTEIAKQNNLKVLPRKQNAAIMAGRFLGVPRAELQVSAEKEKYHLVDFTDTYYEICFGDLP